MSTARPVAGTLPPDSLGAGPISASTRHHHAVVARLVELQHRELRFGAGRCLRRPSWRFRTRSNPPPQPFDVQLSATADRAHVELV